MNLKRVEHGTRTSVLWFDGDDNASWNAWGVTLVSMMDALSRSDDFKVLQMEVYRKDAGAFVEGVEFEWSNGVAAICSDVPNELIIVFDSTLRPRKAGGLIEALSDVWANI